MAKDDYNVIVFKILTYLYGCLQRKYTFDNTAFLKVLITQDIAEEYLTDILRYMQDEELIAGLVFTRAWGGEYLLANDYGDMRITPTGVRYLLENGTMAKIKKAILEDGPAAILTLVQTVLPLL